ncbi:EF-hand calcium-binding domain-containing protein 4B [Ambystoma mexicanum]|uniref:EF-hand calcium-binding domain-containing protein 4B n=1 Tax=Ambystoma mexicanum TaxID=8296 RepID=UPI0037E743BA
MAASLNTSWARPAGTDRNRTRGDAPAATEDHRWSGAGHKDAGQLAMLGKAHEFFRICDIENKGFITRRDMQRLHGELPLSQDELENVFDTLDSDGNGSLSLEEFTTGFSQFLFGEKIPLSEGYEDQKEELRYENVYQSAWEESLEEAGDDEDRHFYQLIDSLGANRLLEDENNIKTLWTRLRKDEPHLLPSFEEFLTRIFSQLHEANDEKNELECALKKKTETYDEEIQNLYEEMEQQIKTEKERFLQQDTERFQSRSQEMEHKLTAKEQELEQIVQKQRRLEKQCADLNIDKHETRVENEKLKLTNKEMRTELERSTQELLTAQRQLQMLQEEASQLHEERDMEIYRVTERLQREKTTLLKQLDLLRETNKHLRDERDSCLQKPKVAVSNSLKNQRSGSIIGKYLDSKAAIKSQSSEEDDAFSSIKINNSVGSNGYFNQPLTEEEHGSENGKTDKQQLQRIISIEEDPLPQLLNLHAERTLHKWTEEEEKEEDVFQEDETVNKHQQPPMGFVPSSPRRQPVGKETLVNEERVYSHPDRLFKIVFVGNSSVGKTSLLRRFCDDYFHAGTSATVGIDYSVKTVTVDNCHVALQLWDTAGQERYRSITKQFFRKADGVIVMYDITCKQTFTSVRQWLVSVEEGAGENIPILLLGNKTDNEKEREVPHGLAEQLAKDCKLLFYECSACSGHNVKESVLHLARLLKEQEDKEKEKTVQLLDSSKKKSCCVK